MIYLTTTSETINIPKTSIDTSESYTLEVFNMVTKNTIKIEDLDNIAEKNYYYIFNIKDSLEEFSDGQYEYRLKGNDGTILTSGLLQFGDFEPDIESYTGQNKSFITYKRN